jgi:hypothetical protein
MVSVSTVLLEVHWLTSPEPQPKPAVQAASAAAPPPAKVEGPNPALNPVYPKKAEAAPPQGDAIQQAQTLTDNAPRVIPGTTVQPVPAQQPVASATPQPPPAAQPVQQQPPSEPAAAAPVQQPTAAAPVQQATATPPVQQASAPAAVHKVAAETTGVASREEDAKPATGRGNLSSGAAASNNRCDVQACAGAYKSFRASDCTYQPFEGVRRVCEKPPGGRSATREVNNATVQPRKLERDVEPRGYSQRASDRRSRQLSEDDEDDRADAIVDDVDDGPSFLFFGRRGRSW